MIRLFCAIAVAVAVLGAACGDDDGNGEGGETPPASQQTRADGFSQSPVSGPTEDEDEPTQEPVSENRCADAAAAAGEEPSGEPQVVATQEGGKPLYSSPPPFTIDCDKRYFATIKTDAGDMRLELYPNDAPQHVNSFVFLAREGFYDGIIFHRVIPGFVAQAGDPTGTGSGGPGYNIPDEVNSRQFLEGTLGMAKTAAPNSAGSQFFIDYAPQPNLDGNYTVFGQLVEGRDVLDQILPRDPRNTSAPATTITTIEIEEEG